MNDEDIELRMLRDFYDKWEALHRIPTNDTNMQQKKQAAQTLVEVACVVRQFRSPVKLVS